MSKINFQAGVLTGVPYERQEYYQQPSTMGQLAGLGMAGAGIYQAHSIGLIHGTACRRYGESVPRRMTGADVPRPGRTRSGLPIGHAAAGGAHGRSSCLDAWHGR